MTTEEDILQQMIIDSEDAQPIDLHSNSQNEEGSDPQQRNPAPDESLFHSLQELDAMEEDLAKQ